MTNNEVHFNLDGVKLIDVTLNSNNEFVLKFKCPANSNNLGMFDEVARLKAIDYAASLSCTAFDKQTKIV